MSTDPATAGLAALSICESLLLSLTENRIIDEAEARGILSDAADAHRQAVQLDGNAAQHSAAAVAIELILESGNSVRRRGSGRP